MFVVDAMMILLDLSHEEHHANSDTYHATRALIRLKPDSNVAVLNLRRFG